jgi:putative ABC transport system permease protein
MSSLLFDIRYALRMLAKSPAFAAAALVCLALGIGANTAIFSVLNGVVLRPLPFGSPERLVVLHEVNDHGLSATFSPADYLDVREISTALQDMAGHRSFNAVYMESGAPVRVRAESVSPQFFQVLDVEPFLGRSFLLEESGALRSVVLSYASWQSRFGADPDIIGRTLTLSGDPHTVIGVAPPTFRYPDDVEFWVRSYRDGVPEPPFHVDGELRQVRNLGYFGVVGRLAEGVEIAEAEAEMAILSRRLQEAREETKDFNGLALVPLHESLVGEVRPALMILFAAVGFVLLIACANVANLLLARATAREREVAVREVLGAGRGRLLRQLLTENMLLGLAGGGAGLLLALWGVEALVRWAAEGLPRSSAIQVEPRVLLFTLVVSLLTGTVFGGIPALSASRVDLRSALREGGRTSTGGRRRSYFRGLLVVSEVALSLVLLSGAGLLIKSLVVLQSEDTGFQSDKLLVMRMSLPDHRYGEEEQQAAFVQAVTDGVSALPGVVSAGFALAHPFSGTAASLRYQVEGVSDPPDGGFVGEYQVITPDYLRTLGMPLLAGRTFTERDHADAPPVAIVNEAMVRRHWPGEDPVGRRITFGGDNDFMEIVGVVGDVRHFAFDRVPQPEVYVPYAYDPWPFMALVIRAEKDPLNLVGAVRAQILAVDPEQPVYGVRTMEEVLRDSTRGRRFTVELLGLFAAVAVVMALVGIYGVMNFSMNQRIHELGIRLALGARRAQVLKLAILWGLKLVVLGIVVGLGASMVLTRFVGGLLYGVSATDPLVFIGVTLLLVLAAGLAAYLPAHRASRVDPIVALRYE